MLRTIARQTTRLALLIPLTLILGCPPVEPPGGNTNNTKPRLRPFASEAEFLAYFREQARTPNTRGGLFPTSFFGESITPAAAGGDGATNDTAGPSFSSTNVQEADVDESDVIKSDGEFLYVAAGNKIRIVRASPRDQMAQVAELQLGTLDNPFYASELYLSRETLLVLGSEVRTIGAGATSLIWPPYDLRSVSTVIAVNVTDPTQPAVLAQRSFDGSIANSRVANDRLILVLTIQPEIPAGPAILALATMGADDVIPKSTVNNVASQLVPWERWLRPEEPGGYNMTAIVTLDVRDITNTVGSTAVMAAAGTIYSSSKALYLTDTEYDPENAFRQNLDVHKFTFDQNGAPQYSASGTVPGRLLNQFSLGEHEGNLYVATHVAAGAQNFIGAIEPGFGPDVTSTDAGVSVATAQSVDLPEPPYNCVYVLGEQNAELQVRGAIEGIAPGERIMSARFMGTRGFLVTFRQVDPLFTLDLSNPADPRIVGELKIPGFSEYLHPLGQTHLIGVGKSAIEFGPGAMVDALQLSLFDLRDPANPLLVQQVEFGEQGSYSDVSFTHKAFTYLPDRKLLAIPATLMQAFDPSRDFVGPEFDGVLVFRVDEAAGFTLLGRLPGAGDTPTYYNNWRRAAFIGNDVYAVSEAGVRGATIGDFVNTTRVLFGP